MKFLPVFIKTRLLLQTILVFLLVDHGFELCHTWYQAVMIPLRAHQSVCFFFVAFLESSHDLG